MKRRLSNNKDIEMKKQRSTDTNTNIIRLLIPSNIAGAVIGKKGQHIQKMRSEYDANVSVDDCSGPERIIFISAKLESVINVIRDILQYLESKSNEVELRVLIHQSLAGCIIGRKGEKIKEIRSKIGCRIYRVFPDVAPLSTDRVVQVIGTPDQCIGTVHEIMNMIETISVKGAIRNYNPANFNEMIANKYGGYGNPLNTKFPDNRRNINQNYHKENIENQNGFGMNQKNLNSWNDNENINSKVNTERDSDRKNLILNRNSVELNFNTLRKSLNEFNLNEMINNNADNYDFKTCQVSIPNNFINIVLAEIHHVRNKCGAFIEIEQSKSNSTDGIITIGGNTEQIQFAQFLLQQSIYNTIKQF